MGSDLIPGINPQAEPSGTGCAECLEGGGWWVHLRRCAECGHIGCCNSSPAQHSSEHAGKTGHQVITSFEPGENWFYDFSTDEFLRGPQLAGPQSRPEGQPVPAPTDKVPANWQELIHR